MNHEQTAGEAERGREDRLSKLRDGVLGHILSFLDTKEAARAAALSSRWRHILSSVHTVSLEEPEPPVPEYDIHGGRNYDPNPPQPFTVAVTTALYARTVAVPSVPLRALRVNLESFAGGYACTVDKWVTGALMTAAPALEVHLRLGRVPLCRRPDPIYDAATSESDDEDRTARSDDDGEVIDDLDDVASSADEAASQYSWKLPPAVYTVPRQLFSSAALRSLYLGSCRLCLPEAISLPALRALHLAHVPDAEEPVQRLISACSGLADLMLEACATVTTLSLLDNTHLRRLTLRCCHNLSTVTDASKELQSFEYRGTVPGNSFLTVADGGGGGFPSIKSCKVDICAVYADEPSTPEQFAMIGSLLQQFFTPVKSLHLCSARMGCCFAALPTFPSLGRLQLNGSVLQHDDMDPVMATSTILERAPNLEHLTLFFETPPLESHDDCKGHCRGDRRKVELLNTHHLHYNQYNCLETETAGSMAMSAACLGSRVRRINLVHYQGGREQRMLARFLLRNALLLERLYCEFAEGHLWIQTELMREMECWVANDTATKVFH